MNYILIENKGEIDPMAFKLIGASTKTGVAGKIGRFGSGLKYAIASMIRNKVGFKVFSGKSEIKFSTTEKRLGDQVFNVITVNGEETSMTTRLGAEDNWDSAFSQIREVYSNALDEGETTMTQQSEVFAMEGKTRFYIQRTAGIEEFSNNKGAYFSDERDDAVYMSEGVSIYPSKNKETRFYRHGILIHTEPIGGAFDYDMACFSMNESRVACSLYSLKHDVVSWMKTLKNKEVIEQILLVIENGKSDTFESSLDWTQGWQSFSTFWGECMQGTYIGAEYYSLFPDNVKEGALPMPHNLLREVKKSNPKLKVVGHSNSGGDTIVENENPDKEMVELVAMAVSKLMNGDYISRLEQQAATIIYVDFITSPEVLARADKENNKIMLANKLVVKGVDEIAKIIIEENEHLITGFGDKTRAFQDHLFDLYFTQLNK